MLEQTYRAQLQIESVDLLHRCCLGLINDQTAVANVIAERRHAPHPQPLAPGSGNLVADPLACNLALELREREQNIQREPTHRGGCIELLCDGDEGDAVRIEYL